SSTEAARVAATVARIPPPAAAICWYVAPAARIAYSRSREPANTRWVCESTKPGTATAPRPSRRRPPSVSVTSEARRDCGPTHTTRPSAAASAPLAIRPSGPSPSEGSQVTSSARLPTIRSAVITARAPSRRSRAAARSRRDARQVEPVTPGSLDRLGIAGVGVAHDPGAGVGGQHALEPPGRVGGAVGDDDHAGVERVADADAAAVVDADPRRAGRGVEQRVQHRPVGDGVGAVAHRLGLAVG